MFKAQNRVDFLYQCLLSTTAQQGLIHFLLSAFSFGQIGRATKNPPACAQFHIVPIGAHLGQVYEGWSLQITPGSPPLSARSPCKYTQRVFLLSLAASERASVRFSSHIEIGKIFAACIQPPCTAERVGDFTADATR